jgi:N-acetylmuramoyl-L-alanine amidase
MFKCQKVVIKEREPVVKVESNIKLAWIVGHNIKKKGAKNYLGEYEYDFSKRIGAKLQVLLADFGVELPIIYRPYGTYTNQVKAVVKKCKELGITHTLNSHFNSYNKKAKGCEVLIANSLSWDDNHLADIITDRLSEILDIPERADDGVKEVSEGHAGSGMLYSLLSAGIHGLILEPCFGDNPVDGAKIFQNEDKYVEILAKSVLSFMYESSEEKNY